MNAELEVRKIAHWHQDFEILPGIWTNGTYRPHFWLNWMDLPARLDGLRILEVGSCDGFFTLELARRGANVVAIDYQPQEQTGFATAMRLNNIECEFHHMNLFEIPERQLGQFDIILCLGVLYHLPDPYRALAILSNCCRLSGKIYIETVANQNTIGDAPVMRFYKGRTLGGDITNFWTQSPSCLVEMTEDVGFRVDRTHVIPSADTDTTRMGLAGVRVFNAESDLRKRLAYGHWIDGK